MSRKKKGGEQPPATPNKYFPPYGRLDMPRDDIQYNSCISTNGTWHLALAKNYTLCGKYFDPENPKRKLLNIKRTCQSCLKTHVRDPEPGEGDESSV
jgi:hypothetical protein